ncbi:MAG: glycosyltransferase family 4 protein [Clostridia bacterium]|nr:glycosyltransferase family 4 protein [Clostridia bacterium]
MKILLVNKFHNIHGGSETYYFSLGEMLGKAGCDVIYFSMKDEENEPCATEEYFVENVDFNARMSVGKTLKTAIKLLYSFEAKEKFEKLIRDERPDIIHLNLFQSQLTGSVVDAAKKYNIPIVHTAHDLKSICPNYKMLNNGKICERCIRGNYTNCFKSGCMKNSKRKSLLATLEAYVYKLIGTYRKLDVIITPSEFYKRKILDANVTDCEIIHMKNFLPSGTEYKLSNAGDYLLFFGRLSEEKGIISLLEAYKKADVDKPLYIVGKGPMEEEIREYIDKNTLADKVFLTGFKKKNELKKIIEASICVCLISEWYENCPCSVMEAMAMGKPVIANDIGGLSEIVKDGETGFVVPAFDTDKLSSAIERMCNLTKEDLLEMSKNALLYAKENFDDKKYLEKLLGIYRSLVK